MGKLQVWLDLTVHNVSRATSLHQSLDSFNLSIGLAQIASSRRAMVLTVPALTPHH